MLLSKFGLKAKDHPTWLPWLPASNAFNWIYPSMHQTSSCSNTLEVATNPYWEVDFERQILLHSVTGYNRLDCCSDRLSNAVISIINGDNTNTCGNVGNMYYVTKRTVTCPQSIVGNVVRIQIFGTSKILALCEVDVFGGYVH